MTRRLALLATLLLALGALAAPASASRTQESTFQDDPLLVFGTPQTVEATLDRLAALGVDRIRVSVFWRAVAPAGGSKTRPAGFDAANPAAYPAGAWERYDRLITAALARGIAVGLNVTAPAPLWATGKPEREDIEQTFTPDPEEFGAFVRAVGTRYSGSFTPPAAQATAPPTPPQGGGPGGGSGSGGTVPFPIPGVTPRSTAFRAVARQAPAGALPRVAHWEVYNEPNQAGWLTPQWVDAGGGKLVEAAPFLYRSLLDAAYAGLQATGHGADTILVGSTAPKGLNVKGTTRAIKALNFLRRLYCLDDRYRPLRGEPARQRGCSATPDLRAFRTAHPALFRMTGWAHHPYELALRPSLAPRDPDFVTIANLPRLTQALRRATGAYRVSRAGGVPLYLTEFGYQTNPPDRFGVSFSQQAAYLNESEFIAYSDASVRSLNQFLLRDDGGDVGRTFQSGLQSNGGDAKPSLDAYRLPIHLPVTSFRRGGAVRVWGLVRSAPAEVQRVALEFRPAGGSAWRRVAVLPSDARRGYVDRRVRLPGSGRVRLTWREQSSRSVSVRRR